MTSRIIISLLAWICGTIAIHAGNGVTVSNAEGNVGETVDINLDLTTESPDLVAAEIHIPLPEHITPISESCVRVGNRLADHMVSADMNEGEYVIVIFNTSLAPIPTGSGTVLSFKLNIGDNPGIFTLSPRVKLSDSAGNTLDCTSKSGTLTAKGARLQLSTCDIDFGRVPIKGVYDHTVTATNTGTADLHISGFKTEIPELKVSAASTTVAPGKSTTLKLSYSPVKKASLVDGGFSVESNSVGNAPFVRVTAAPFSVNDLSTGNAQGVSDSEVTVALVLNNMDPVAGVDITYSLPEGMEYVEGSVATTSRAADFTPESFYDSQRNLRLLLFSAANDAIAEGDGEFLSFRLRLTGHTGSYTLTPQKVILSSPDGENIVSNSVEGNILIISPALQSDSEMELGDVPINGNDIFYYKVKNVGKATLKVDKILFSNDILTCDENFPVTISVGETASIPVKIGNPVFGKFSTEMNLYSNDPDNRMKAVDISGFLYSPNELSFSTNETNNEYILSATLVNEAEITALQMDILAPAGVTTGEDLFSFTTRASDHSFTLAEPEPSHYRLIIFSLSNTPFSGHDGVLFSLGFKGVFPADKNLKIEKIILSSADGTNFTTPGTEMTIPSSGVIKTFSDTNQILDIYTLNGTLVRHDATPSDLPSLPAGIYIINGIKTLLK